MKGKINRILLFVYKLGRKPGGVVFIGLAGALLSFTSNAADTIQQAALEPKSFTVQGLTAQTGSPSISPAALPHYSHSSASIQAGYSPQNTHKLQGPPALVGVDLAKEADDVWEFIRRGFAIPDLFMKNIGLKERDLLRSTEHLTEMLRRSEPYIHYIATECEKRGLPAELALVPFVESRFNPHARSHAQAEGLWQIIPSTGKHFDLKQNQWVDQRRDLVASTRVALDYFTYLYDMFGDWHLALLAYNWGEGSVQKVIKNAKVKGLQPNIGNLDLPEETRRYVPKLQAIKNVIQNPEHYGVTLPHLPNAPYFVEIRRKSNVDLREMAKRTGVELDIIKALNPGLQQDTWHVAHNEALLVPVQYEKQFRLSMKQSSDPAVIHATTQAASSQSRTGKVTVSKVSASKKSPKSSPGTIGKSKSFKSYEVRKGESLKDLAARFGMAKEELISLNGLGRKPLKPGMLISIPH